MDYLWESSDQVSTADIITWIIVIVVVILSILQAISTMKGGQL